MANSPGGAAGGGAPHTNQASGVLPNSNSAGGAAAAGGKQSFSVDLPDRRYTMPDAEINHYITDKDLETIREGGRNYLFDICLATFGAMFGFVQNFITLIENILDDKTSGAWTYWGAFFFLIFAVSTVCLYLTGRRQQAPLKTLVDEIETRPQKPYSTTEET